MFRPGTDQLPLYPHSEEPAWRSKLDANERPAALPATVRREIDRRLRTLETHRYPDMTAKRLRGLLAEAYQGTLEQVLVGNGSSELIAAVCATFGGAGRPIAYQWPSFSMYPVYAAMADSPVAAVPLDDAFRLSADTVRRSIQESGAKLLLLCNPNNPTGTLTPPDELRTIIAQSPCPVLVDEAYMEYGGESCIPWLADFPHLMVTRTFSKAYGLAAARIGYLLASPEICAAVGKRLLPYHSNSYSLTLAEVCFIHREEVLEEARKTVRRRERLRLAAKKLGAVEVFPSSTNFLLVRVQEPDALRRIFSQNGVGVRDFSYMPELRGCFRITVGAPLDNRRVYDCLTEYQRSRTGEENADRG